MKQTKQTLWTAGFSRTTIATILNAIGGEAMNLPISLLVFDQTGSTLLSSLVLVCGILPDVLLPLLAAPFVERGRKKTWIVGLDSATALFYLAMGLFVSRHAFHYPLYLAFVLIIGSISACCRLAYQAWYPSLIPAGLEQKGYAVSNTIYPFIAIAMSSFAAFLYKEISMAQIFYLVTLLTVLSVLVELGIPEAQTKECEQGCGDGTAILTQAYYQTMPGLTVTMLGFLRSAEMIGRFLGGLWQYQKEIPEKSVIILPNLSIPFITEWICCCVFFQLAAGVLGQWIPYRLAVVLLALVGFF